MGMAPFLVSAKLPSEANAELPKHAATETAPKLPSPDAQLPHQRLRTAERLRRLEEAKAFLRQYLAGGPQPARKLLQAAKAAGIAVRTLHRAKDLLGVRTERAGGYAGHGQWVWYPAAPVASLASSSRQSVSAVLLQR